MFFRNALIFLVGAVFLCGCENTGDKPAAVSSDKEEAKPRIALVMKTLTNPFFVAMEKGAREAEQELGIKLLVRTAAQETSIHQQIDIVNKLIREKSVQAIVIAPGDSVQLIPILKDAQNQGIIVVNIDNKLDAEVSKKYGLTNVPFISVDNENAAYLSAKHIADKIKTPTKVAIIEGIPSALNAQERKAGAMRAFAENSRIQVVASETAHWKIDEGFEVAKNILTQHPDVGAFFCANDMMALGAIRHLTETKRKEVLVAAFDAIDEAMDALKDGSLAVTIDQLPYLQGHQGVVTAYNMIKGEQPASEVMIDIKVVTAETLNQ